MCGRSHSPSVQENPLSLIIFSTARRELCPRDGFSILKVKSNASIQSPARSRLTRKRHGGNLLNRNKLSWSQRARIEIGLPAIRPLVQRSSSLRVNGHDLEVATQHAHPTLQESEVGRWGCVSAH